jgi:hypothetical protein
MHLAGAPASVKFLLSERFLAWFSPGGMADAAVSAGILPPKEWRSHD